MLLFSPSHATPLTDTGLSSCYNATSIDATGVDADAGGFPRQDCRYGVDAATAVSVNYKVGAGSAGFDYTKIANDGSELAAGVALGSAAGDWACTRDNVTGLIWEVKTTSGLRNKGHTYTWYSSVGTSNGGNVGTVGVGSTCATAGRCDTEKFVADVNALSGSNRLCGNTDWRLPTVSELQSLVDFSGTGPATIDATYFPNTPATWYWTGANYAAQSNSAWFVKFNGGSSDSDFKSWNFAVRLVRSGP